MYTYTFGGKDGKKNTLHESTDRVVVRTKNAGVGLVEFFKKKVFSKYIDSLLFLYKETRNLMHETGDNGYGWLSYDYVPNGLAVDWWSLLKNGWIDTGNFKV